MARILEQATVRELQKALGCEFGSTPSWLLRPGLAECGVRWSLVCDIYLALTGLQLPEKMPPRETRRVDAVIELPGQPPRIFEFDESQHFNSYRATTLGLYPEEVESAFPRQTWLLACDESTRKLSTTGGWGKAKPPLFPEPGGRHVQRAFRDALADLLPGVHGWAPTLRLADFEVEDWIQGSDAQPKLGAVLAERLVL
jgi:hypothetical protein